jgi:hypothetical protein
MRLPDWIGVTASSPSPPSHNGDDGRGAVMQLLTDLDAQLGSLYHAATNGLQSLLTRVDEAAAALAPNTPDWLAHVSRQGVCTFMLHKSFTKTLQFH